MTSRPRNPFEYEQATKFTNEELADYYIEDFNYSRFVSSQRNVFLVGERGTGKTMTFLYHSLPVQRVKAQKRGEEFDLTTVSIYVPCSTPLTHRTEYDLLDHLTAALISEHFLVTSMIHATAKAIEVIADLLPAGAEETLRKEIAYVLNIEIPEEIPFFRGLLMALDRASVQVQEALNGVQADIRASFFSFNSGFRPFLACLKQIPLLRESHFSLMIDDAHLLNRYQIRALNSWIAYRDNAMFSIKVATTRVDAPTRETSSGGTILEGHDFTRIDLEQPYQNRTSVFGKLAQEIIGRRLESIEVRTTPDEYFPPHPAYTAGMEEARRKAESEAEERFPNGTQKQRSDYVYKYTPAIYYRERSPRANLPPYAGFDLLVHLSTGVIRNLLDPCWHMYDRMISEVRKEDPAAMTVKDPIPPNIQDEIIQERSRRKWDWIRQELDKAVEGCSREQACHVYQLLDNLAILFKKRLQARISEPRAVVFTISGLDEAIHSQLLEILKIAQKAQIIYTFTSAAKDLGKRETYYVPNRILWPQRGLDPQGQHARVSIPADTLLAATVNNAEIPFEGDEQSNEPDLFSGTD
jgi:hypothetical protein